MYGARDTLKETLCFQYKYMTHHPQQDRYLRPPYGFGPPCPVSHPDVDIIQYSIGIALNPPGIRSLERIYIISFRGRNSSKHRYILLR